MTQAIRIEAVGGPDVLNYVDVSVAEPGDGEVRLRQTAIGLNYMDVNHRTGVYPLPSFPAIIGVEGAGVIEEVGPGVSGFVEGDRVAYCLALGAYATHRIIAASQLNKLPADISDEEGAAGMV